MKVDDQKIYGVVVENGIMLTYASDGVAVTRLYEDEHPLLWPVDTDVSAYYEHPEGIVLKRSDAEKLGIEIEQ